MASALKRRLLENVQSQFALVAKCTDGIRVKQSKQKVAREEGKRVSQLLRRLLMLRTRLALLPRRMVRLIRHQMSDGRHLVMWVERRVRDDGDRRVGGARLHHGHRGRQRVLPLGRRTFPFAHVGRRGRGGRLSAQRFANLLELLAEIVVQPAVKKRIGASLHDKDAKMSVTRSWGT